MSDPALLQDKVKMFYKRFANAVLIAVTELEVKGNTTKSAFYSSTFSNLLQALTGIRPWTGDFKIITIKTKITNVIGDGVSGVDALGDIAYAMVSILSSTFTQAELKVLSEAHRKARARSIKLLDLNVPEKEYSATDETTDLFELGITILNQLPLDAYREMLSESRNILNSLYPEEEPKR